MKIITLYLDIERDFDLEGEREETDRERDLAGERREVLAFGDLLQNIHSTKISVTDMAIKPQQFTLLDGNHKTFDFCSYYNCDHGFGCDFGCGYGCHSYPLNMKDFDCPYILSPEN